MRAPILLPVALLALLGAAGAASASDYMLPVLLGPDEYQAGVHAEQPVQEQVGTFAPAATNPAIVGVALLGALVVVAGTLGYLRMLDRRPRD